MKKWTDLESTLSPDGQTVSLHEHDGSYAIRVGGTPLMSTRQSGSEEAMAELACTGLGPRARVLIGGLGFGFTLKAALRAVGPDASIVVSEILEAVIAWNRNPAYELASNAMTDPRVTVLHEDVNITMRRSPASFDAILLDVDNGPEALTTEGNGSLYDDAGLRRIIAALRPRGCVAFWSAHPDAAFENRLARVGFRVATHLSRAHKAGGRRHTIFLGRI